MTYVVIVILAVTAGVLTLRQTFGQTNRYIVTELSSDDAGQVPCKINSLGDIVGRKDSPLEGGPRATIWNRSRSNSKHLGALWDGDYSSASGINDAGEVVGVIPGRSSNRNFPPNYSNGIIESVGAAVDNQTKIVVLPEYSLYVDPLENGAVQPLTFDKDNTVLSGDQRVTARRDQSDPRVGLRVSAQY